MFHVFVYSESSEDFNYLNVEKDKLTKLKDQLQTQIKILQENKQQNLDEYNQSWFGDKNEMIKKNGKLSGDITEIEKKIATIDTKLEKEITDKEKKKAQNIFHDRYENSCSKIGQGAFGTVEKCNNTKPNDNTRTKGGLNGDVAVKTVNVTYGSGINLTRINTIENEVAIMKRLQHPKQHPNILNILDSAEFNFNFRNETSTWKIATEICSGGDLRNYITTCREKKKTMSKEALKKITMELMSAVEYIHSKNIAHRDIKPANIMFVTEVREGGVFPSIKLIDFGQSNHYGRNNIMTKIVGTPGYQSYEMAPFGKVEYNELCDEWACGVVLYECVDIQCYISRGGGYPNSGLHFPNPRRVKSEITEKAWLAIVSGLLHDLEKWKTIPKPQILEQPERWTATKVLKYCERL